MSRHVFQATAAPPWDFDLNPRRDPALGMSWREPGTMTPQDYAELGFICGLEVHQQLATRSKLFCRCPSGRRVTRVDGEVLRHMRPTLSELGQYDGCALMEFKTRKEIVYLLERNSVCTYEMDDTPPFGIDPEAVRYALEISRLFDLKLVSELQVMRKQYLDGSIPTGFQRSTMIALGGEIPFRESELGPGRVLRIRQLTLEEDSCREVSDVGHRITFRTDRLGEPLIETVTEPDLLTPLDVMHGGRLLARVARVSGHVRRGPGAARQDVNVSVAGSRRIEIKGVGNHRRLPLLVHVEAFRQLELLRIREELLLRGVTREMLELPWSETPWGSHLVADARQALRGAEYPPIAKALERGDFIAVVRLPRFGELLGHRTQPATTFAHEFADRVKVIACLTARPFMITSHVTDYGLKASTWRRVRAAAQAADGDALVLLWGPEEDVATGCHEVLLRAQEALVGVPAETRQAFADGTTGLERILPGPERMYPDTDTPPFRVPDPWVERAEIHRAELPWDRVDRWVASGLAPRVAARLSDAPWADLFDALAPREHATAQRLVHALEKRLPHLWRETGRRELPAAARLAPLVAATDSGELRPEGFERVLDRLLRETYRDAADLVASHGADAEAAALLERRIAGLLAARGALRPLPDDAVERWAMGRVMTGLHGRVDLPGARARIRAALGITSAPEHAA